MTWDSEVKSVVTTRLLKQSDGTEEAAGAELCEAFCLGVLSTLPISLTTQRQLKRAWTAFGEFCRLQEGTKTSYERPDTFFTRGYLARGSMHVRKSERWKLVDRQEAWHSGRGANRWPSETPELGKALSELFLEFETIGLRLIRSIGRHLDDDGYLKSLIVGPGGRLDGDHLLRILYYPGLITPAENHPSTKMAFMRHNEHEDLSLLTLVAPPSLKSLALRKGDDLVPLTAEVVPAIAVFPGKILRSCLRGTNCEFPESVHAVLAGADDLRVPRHSFAMFITPNPERPLRSLSAGDLIAEQAGMFIYELLKERRRTTEPTFSAFMSRYAAVYRHQS